MKICFVHDRFKSVGGVERHLTNLANELVSREYEIEIICFDKFHDNFLTNSLDSKIKKTQFRFPRVLGFIPLFFYLRRNRKTYKAIISSKSYVDMMTIPVVKLSRCTAKLYCTIVTLLSLQIKFESNFFHKILLSIIFFFNRRLYKFTDGLVVISKMGITDFNHWLPSKKNIPNISVIYNAMLKSDELIKKHEQPDHPWFSQDLENKKIPIIVSCGRLCAVKNFELLIDAFKLVKKTTDARLLILGEGKLLGKLQKLVKNYKLEDFVSFTGVVNNPEAYFAYSDLYVLTSEYEGFGIVLVEALAAGIPIVMSDRTPILDEISDFNKFHRVAYDYTPEGFAAAIIEQLKLLPDYNSAQIREQAKQFTIVNSADKYEELFCN
ncbi:MAG: glycosyltransferase [Gammaproteobacteria bacterium]|nr:glycosyltransferase [Gammaproteobacteria bacterium]